MTKQRVIILGSGFAGIRLAQELDKRLFEVTIVSPRNYFLFTPLLTSTAVGTIEFRSIIEPVRHIGKGISFFQASARSIDAVKQEVLCSGETFKEEFALKYDFLAIAVGSVNNTFGIPGVEEHSLFLKDIADARAVRQRIVDTLEHASTPDLTEDERAKLLRVVVIGGGPTGIELAAEIRDFVHEDLRRWFPDLVGKVTITVLEATENILGSFSQRLQDYALTRLRRYNIDVRLSAQVSKVEADRVMLSDGVEIPTGVTIWTAGIAPNRFVRELPFAKDSRGNLATSAYLNVIGHENVFAIGDCATVESLKLPATAQRAEREGKYLAYALNRRAKGKSVNPFRFRDMGMLAYIGGRRALADLPGVKGGGFLTWIFWRMVYLTKIVSFKNRVLVLFDWFKAAVFGRDISRF